MPDDLEDLEDEFVAMLAEEHRLRSLDWADIEAMREVDAMTPTAPPMLPAQYRKINQAGQ